MTIARKPLVSGRSYEHQRQWIVDGLGQLADLFAMAYAVMNNHYHPVVRLQPERGIGVA